MHTPMQTVYLLHHYSNPWISIQVIMYLYSNIYIYILRTSIEIVFPESSRIGS